MLGVGSKRYRWSEKRSACVLASATPRALAWLRALDAAWFCGSAVLHLTLPRELAERYPIVDDGDGAPVFERWRRAVDLVVRADGPAHPDGVDGSALDERRLRLADAFRRDDLLAPVPRELIDAGYSAIIADAEGYIVEEAASARFANTAARVRLVRGAKWSESSRGTNAIGTALCEDIPVAVVGDAHYERANRSLVCYAAPIHDPTGRVVAVFDVTSDVQNASPLADALVTAVARVLEQTLYRATFDRALPGGLSVIERLIEKTPGPAWLVGTDGRIRLANARSSRARAQGESFGVAWEPLQRAANDVGFVVSPENERLELQPIEGPDGVTIAVVAFSHGKAKPKTTSVHPAFDGIVGTDAQLGEARATASRFARSTLPVMLLAETGSGKELFARAIHAASDRADGPFVAVNCGALSSSLLESELFGYAPGAFTGASASGHGGMIGAASGGTLFLDEVAEMSPALQAALLRVLEDGSYHRLGDTRLLRADVRIVTATCRDLPAMVRASTFRNDLYYRLRGATIALPAVRARTDRVELAQALLEGLARATDWCVVPKLGATARTWIESHSWPGNVRELKMALAHALVLADETIEAEHFPGTADAARPSTKGATPSRQGAEAIAVQAALQNANGNMSEAARILGVARSTLYRMKRRHGL